MKTVYIHVGFPKTGTKYLSRNFFSKISKIKNFGKKQSLNDVDEELLLCFNKIMHLPKIDKKDEKMIIRCFKNLKIPNLNCDPLRYCLNNNLINQGLWLEFGVWKGQTLQLISNYTNIIFYLPSFQQNNHAQQ